MRPITSARGKRLPALIAALVLLVLSLACNEGNPTVSPTPTPMPDTLATAIAVAVATVTAQDAANPAPSPTPELDPSPTPVPDNIATAVAQAVATVTAAAADNPAPSPTLAPGISPVPVPTPSPVPAPGLSPTPAPSPIPTAGISPTPVANPTPALAPTPTPAVASSAEATATAAAEINAQAAALTAAVNLAFDYLGRNQGDVESAIAYAISATNANPDAVARAVNEVLGGLPPSFTAKGETLPDDLARAVTIALQYIARSPNDIAGAVNQASSETGVDAGAIAAAVDQVLNNPFPTPNVFVYSNVDIDTALNAINAASEARAISGATAGADAIEATRQAQARASVSVTITPAPTPTYVPPPVLRYDHWNNHEWLAEPKQWWRDSNPYDCDPPANTNSPWTAAGMPDLGGQDPLSLIRYFGNGSYVRYGLMGFEGCTLMSKYPERTHLDTPLDPTYYSLGNLQIAVDIARVPVNAADWPYDNGSRVDMSMAEAVSSLNTHVAAYFRKISGGKLRMSFVAGHDFQPSGRATPQEVEDQWLALIGIVGCDPDNPDRPGCRWGTPGALNRFFLNDVASSSGGSAWNGYADLGLVSVKNAVMMTLIHEIGHSWMFWPHSYTELPWRPDANKPYQRPNFYSNPHDFMSELTFRRPVGWHQDIPATLAINRYAAGWIAPGEVALHLSDAGTYKLARPMQSGNQFLVIHSGRPGAFTTLEVLDERNAVYRDTNAVVYAPASAGGKRPIRYEGVMVSRYDQTNGTGVNARAGPALYNSANPNYESDVGYGRDDYSVIADGESRSIGGGVTVRATKNSDGSYDVTVSGGRTAGYEPWCVPIWFPPGGYDTGCTLDGFDFGNSP